MCDVPHEKVIPGKSQNFFGIFAGKVTGTGKKLAGKLVGVLARNCGEKGGKLWGVVGSSGIREMKRKQSLQGDIVLANTHFTSLGCACAVFKEQ